MGRRLSATTKAKISATTRVQRGPTRGLDTGTKKSGIGVKGNKVATPVADAKKAQGSSSSATTGKLSLRDLPVRSQRNIVAGSINRMQRDVHTGDVSKAVAAGKGAKLVLSQTSLPTKTLTNLNVTAMKKGRIPVAKHPVRKKPNLEAAKKAAIAAAATNKRPVRSKKYRKIGL